ncbi:MAG: hypothetical protein IPH89_10275 [Bacteroidetes bacterium]|nr:hypothetical protein [Bacteroidota bacterium]
MIKKISLLFILISVSIAGFAQKDSLKTNTGLIYGHNHSYFLTAPSGWVLDNESGREENLMAVFYPKGETWADAETVMYTTFTSYDTTKNEKLKDVILYDSTAFIARAPKIKIKAKGTIQIGKNKNAVVYEYADAENKNFERVAYIAEKKGVAMIIITSRTKNGLEKNAKKFQSLTKTYRFLTDQVKLPD